MKKFVILMISFLVLFVFLMLNYLLWDKENLQKQSASDKIEQDWLRGQNRTLQSTIEEQEADISQLKRESQNYQSRIIELEQQLRQTKDEKETSLQQMEILTQAVSEYQLYTLDTLKSFTNNWFLSINEARYEDAYGFFSSDAVLFEKALEKEAFEDGMSRIKSISLVEQDEELEKLHPSFEIMKGMGNVYEVMAKATIELNIAAEADGGKDAEDKKSDTPGENALEPFSNLVEGVNQLQITYRYFPEEKKWVMVSILAITGTKP